ncbi:AMP-binding protein [Ekhidna sp.]|uniref:AMP-binding protein n=1 Tax=Ekhidna sp. TaxID=2608089 RepID=UPI003298F042
MIIRSKNFVLKLEEILKEELPTERYNEHENIVLTIIRQWYANKQVFTHRTSGSTGRPKKINISRDKIEISARATLSFIDPENKIKTSLLCLSPLHIGGAMVIYRSLIFDHDLTIVDPTTESSEEFANESFDLVSLVPLQFKKLDESQMNRFKTILIGGAPIATQNVQSNARIYSTFGMTETISHIALRPLHEELFMTTGDNEVAADSKGLLKIRGAITDFKWLTTNDIVTVISNNTFQWIGRYDFVINSGGIKVNPEDIERQLKSIVTGEFMIGSLPDEILGRKIILITNGDEKRIDFSQLEKYHRPKASYFNRQIVRTSSGKLDRLKTQELLEQSL